MVPSVSGWRAPLYLFGRKSTRRVLSGWRVSPYRARRLPRTDSTRLASIDVVERHQRVVGEPDKDALPSQTRFHLGLEPFVQHMVQEDVREAGRNYTPLRGALGRAA